MNSVDPKFRPWATVKKELEKIEEENPGGSDSPRSTDDSLCLTHGFHHIKSYTFRDGIRCLAYRSNASSEEFLLNHGVGSANVLHLKTYRKDNTSLTMPIDEQNAGKKKDSEEIRNRFHIQSPPLQHLVWVSKHRFFVGIGNDKNLRVFADTMHRCQILSAPTCCAMPVLSMVYVEETDEVVTGGIGVIQPWKIRLSSDVKSEESPNVKSSEATASQNAKNISTKKKDRRGSKSSGMPNTKNKVFGQGRQMLQASTPYPCDLRRDEWVLDLRVYNGSSGGSVIRGSKNILIATSADAIVAIDFVKRKQLWIVRLESSLPTTLNVSEKLKFTQSSHEVTNHAPANSYVIRGHVSLRKCEFFPRFGYFITGGGEGAIHIMNTVNFGLVTELVGHRHAITGLVAHKKHPILISSSCNGSIRVWCLETFREIQRIDTGQCIEDLNLTQTSNLFYYYSKRKISVYLFHNLYSLYSIPHSTPVNLFPIRGDSSQSLSGKILSPLEDGSVAVLSPVTGMMLTMIYPMTSFQVFNDIVFDIYSSMCYIKLQQGCVMQCDCSTNPCIPLQCYKPNIPYDEDVFSIASVKIQFSDGSSPVTAILGGLCSGQIILIRPNSIWMTNVQAHAGPVRFMQTMTDVQDHANEDSEVYCQDELFSIGASSVRIWKMSITTDGKTEEGFMLHQGKVAIDVLHLQPITKVLLPSQALHPTFVAALEDRVCLAREDNQLIVLEINKYFDTASASRKHSFAEQNSLYNIHNYLGAEKKKKSNYMKLNVEDRIRIEHALEQHRRSTDMTHATSEHLMALKKQSTFVYTHHHEDDHSGKITSLISSQKLRFFASSSDNGYVKIWDERNRLIRELCFAPNPVTAISFANGRDLLVGLEGRLYACECTNFLTTQLIVDRSIASMQFTDDVDENAVSYDDDIKVISNIDLLPATLMMANERQSIPDTVAEINAKRLMTSSQYTFRGSSRDALGVFSEAQTQEFMKHMNHMMKKRKEEESIANEIEDEIDRGPKRWKELFKNINRKIRRGSIAIFRDEGRVVEFMQKRVRRGYGLDAEDFNIFSKGAGETGMGDICSMMSKDKIDLEKASMVDFPKDSETGSRPSSPKEKRLPIPPFGYVPNSVVRKIVKPPPPPPELSPETLRLRFFPQVELPSELPMQQEAGTKSSEIEEETVLPDYNVSSLDLGSFSGRRSRFGSLFGESQFEDVSYYDEDEEEADVQMSDDDFEIYQKMKPGSRGGNIAIRKLGNTMAGNDKEASLAFSGKQRKGGGKVPRYNSPGRGILSAPQKRDEFEEVKTLEESVSTVSEIVEQPVADEMKTVIQKRAAPQLKSKADQLQSRADMKAKLLQQRTEAVKSKEEKIVVHPLLEEIAKAPWFRKKLSQVTADVVAEALLEIGNTTRTVAHQKACENLSKLVAAFGPNGTDRGMYGTVLSDGIVDKIRVFVASYFTPRYSLTGIESQVLQKQMKESKRTNPNRVGLAHNALDAIESGIGTSEEIICGILRLAADENEGIKQKAMKILTTELKIDTWEKLAAKLKDIVGEESVMLPPENHVVAQKEVFYTMLQRVKQGLLTLANAPRIAERLNLRIAERRQSKDDDDVGDDVFPTQSYSTSISTDRTPSHQLSKIQSELSKRSLGPNKEESILSISSRDAMGARGGADRVKFAEKVVQQRKKSRITKREILRKKSSGVIPGVVEWLRPPKIKWEKAVPESTKQRMRMTKIMRAVQAATRLHRVDDRIDEPPMEGSCTSWNKTESDMSMHKTPPITASATVTDDSSSENVKNYRLPRINRKQQLSLVTLSDMHKKHLISDTNSTTYDSALGGSLSTYITPTSDPSTQKERKIKALKHRNEDSGYLDTDQKKTSYVADNSWRSYLKTLKAKKELQKTHRADEGNISQKRNPVKLPVIARKTSTKEPWLIRNQPVVPGQRLATHYTVTAAKSGKSCDGTIICPLPARFGTQTCTKTSGESRYGVLSIKWTNQPVGEGRPAPPPSRCLPHIPQSVINEPQICLTSQGYASSSCRDFNNCNSRGQESSLLFRDYPYDAVGVPAPTPDGNERSYLYNSVVDYQVEESVQSSQRHPVSFYQINSKSLKKLMKSAITVAQKKRVKLPKIPTEPPPSGRRSINIRIPSCNSSVLCATPYDVVE